VNAHSAQLQAQCVQCGRITWSGLLVCLLRAFISQTGSEIYIGCRSNAVHNTRLTLQCSRSWQHDSRTTLPTPSGFVLLHANFGPGEGICYMTTVLI